MGRGDQFEKPSFSVEGPNVTQEAWDEAWIPGQKVVVDATPERLLTKLRIWISYGLFRTLPPEVPGIPCPACGSKAGMFPCLNGKTFQAQYRCTSTSECRIGVQAMDAHLMALKTAEREREDVTEL